MILDPVYAAGLFDGEGFFNIDKTKRRGCRSPSYQVHARITMRDSVLVFGLQETFAGSVRKCASKSEKHADYYSWDVCGEGVVRLVERIGSFLIIKKSQALVAADFQAFKKTNKNQPNTDERIRKLEFFYLRMRELNKKGVSR